MKHKSNSIGAFLLGLAIGGLTLGGSVAYASGIVANLSTTPIYVDGELATIEAYMINGHNYVQLRDIGKAVDFDVSWDGEHGRAIVESDKPYAEDDAPQVEPVGPEIPATAKTTVDEMITQSLVLTDDEKSVYRIRVDNETHVGKLSTGEDATVDNIKNLMNQFAEIYPELTSWGDSTNDGDIYWYSRNLEAKIGGTYGCNSYAYVLRDILYGRESEPVTVHNDLSKVRIGDVVHLSNDATGAGHWIVVTDEMRQSATGNLFFRDMSGNCGAKVSINDVRYLDATRLNYPDSTIYCYYP